MLIYLDESYQKSECLFIGALFLPGIKTRKKLHKQFKQLKITEGFVTNDGKLKEIKYSKLTNQYKLSLAKKAVKLFATCDDVFFRACVIHYKEDQLEKLGKQKGVPIKIKRAMLYTKATIQLIRNNIKEAKNSILLMDRLTRARGDRFDQIIRYKLGEGDNPVLRHISYVDSKQGENHTIQICDLLLGAVLNEHYPASSFKNAFREYVKKELGLPKLNSLEWKGKTQTKLEAHYPKFIIRFWKLPYDWGIL